MLLLELITHGKHITKVGFSVSWFPENEENVGLPTRYNFMKFYHFIKMVKKKYIAEQNQCTLNCRPLGYKFYATLNRTVADGTSCHLHTGEKGACLDGKCQVNKILLIV